MREAAVLPLAAWVNFYVIIGTAAASLTGLMFIVITLIASRRRSPGSISSIAAFGTPTVVHFGIALLIAALLSAPWQTLWHVGLLLGLCGLGGITYIAVTVWRTRGQTDYKPVLEDWLWHAIFPLASYISLVITAFLLLPDPALALFWAAAGTLLFLFIGIHNAWDTVTYIIIQDSHVEDKGQDQG